MKKRRREEIMRRILREIDDQEIYKLDLSYVKRYEN